MTSLFERNGTLIFVLSLCFSRFHHGCTYSGTFDTEGGGLGALFSHESGLTDAFSRYKASPVVITFNGVTTESLTKTGLHLRLFDTLELVAIVQPF